MATLQNVPDGLRLSTVVVTALLSATSCAGSQEIAMARAQLARGDYDGADRTLKSAVAAGSSDALALQMRVHLGKGQPESAVKLYQKRRDSDLLRALALGTIWAAMRHRDPDVRLAGIQVARRLDAGQLATEMARRLDDPDERVRTWAAVALSGVPGGADVLQRQLDSKDPQARSIAIVAVGRLAKAKALPAIERQAGHRSAVVRAASADALQASGVRSDRAVALLTKLIKDEKREVRLAAAKALLTLAIPGSQKAIREGLQDDYLPVRKATLQIYDRLAKDDALPYLREAARGEDISLALLAGRLLAKRGETQPVLDAVAKGLVDKRWTIRVVALNTASMLEDRVAWDLAKRALRDAEPAVRLAAVRLFIAHGKDKAAVADSQRVLRSTFALLCPKDPVASKDIPRCIESAELLARRKDDGGRKTLAALAQKAKKWGHRAQALRLALLHTGDRDIAVVGLGDAEPRVALEAAQHLFVKLE
jgi:HEAT repeat protein